MYFKLLAAATVVGVALLSAVCRAQVGLPNPVGSAQYNLEEERAAAFLVDAEEQLRNITEMSTFIEWAFESNINDDPELSLQDDGKEVTNYTGCRQKSTPIGDLRAI